MTTQQPEKRRMPDIAVVACAAIGTGTGTGLMVGAPMYAMTKAEDRTYTRTGAHHISGNGDAIAIGALGFALGVYVFQRSARWLYERIYG